MSTGDCLQNVICPYVMVMNFCLILWMLPQIVRSQVQLTQIFHETVHWAKFASCNFWHVHCNFICVRLMVFCGFIYFFHNVFKVGVHIHFQHKCVNYIFISSSHEVELNVHLYFILNTLWGTIWIHTFTCVEFSEVYKQIFK